MPLAIFQPNWKNFKNVEMKLLEFIVSKFSRKFLRIFVKFLTNGNIKRAQYNNDLLELSLKYNESVTF